MNRFMFLLSLAVVLIFATSQLSTAALFKADFSNASGVNDPAAWTANNVTAGLNVFAHDAASGRLEQTIEGCGNSTKTPFPVDGSGWADYIVSTDVWFPDNDTISILFRYTDENNYYNFTVGAGDFNNEWYLGIATANEAECYDGARPNIATGPLGLTIDETGGTAYTLAVIAVGSTIDLFFGEQTDVEAGQFPPKVGGVTDGTYTSGTAGLHFGSLPCFLDNILVIDALGAAVDSQDKLATTWAELKAN